MKKERPTVPLENTLFADSLEENKFIQWVADNGRNLLFVLLALLILFIAIYKMAFSGTEKSEFDFIRAENDYQAFIAKTDPKDQIEILNSLNALMQRHPELHAKYDSLIAQRLINQNSTTEALPYAIPSIQRTKSDNEPFYSDYSQTTLLIGQNQYQEALQKALTLKQSMIDAASQLEKKTFGDLLFAYNLLRIGMLQQQLGLEKEELSTWREWKRHAALEKEALIIPNIDNKAFQDLTNNFQEGKISLTNYIEAREKLLKNS